MNRYSLVISATFAVLVGACGGEASSQKPADAPTTASGSVPATKSSSDIIDTANNAGQFKTLIAAVKAADLETTLRGSGPFTVFAPTDEAFAKLPPGTVESLLKPENKAKLQSILTYHVVSGKVMSPEAVKLTSAKSVQGKALKLDASSGSLMVGSTHAAKVVKADVEASNGVIHVIDAVVLPE